jgi:hypothetical protein
MTTNTLFSQWNCPEWTSRKTLSKASVLTSTSKALTLAKTKTKRPLEMILKLTKMKTTVK